MADLQLRNPPPRFVGLKSLANDRGWQGPLGSLIDRGPLITYLVPNPKAPEASGHSD